MSTTNEKEAQSRARALSSRSTALVLASSGRGVSSQVIPPPRSSEEIAARKQVAKDKLRHKQNLATSKDIRAKKEIALLRRCRMQFPAYEVEDTSLQKVLTYQEKYITK
jgi:hypothetical protein